LPADIRTCASHRRVCDAGAAEFEPDPFTNSLFLFCSRRRDRLKALLWGGWLHIAVQAPGGREVPVAVVRSAGAGPYLAGIPVAHGGIER
jgi:hypothetical protein